MSNSDESTFVAGETGHEIESGAGPEPTASKTVKIVRLPTQISQMEVIVPYAMVAEITEVMLPEGGTHLSRLDAAMVDWRAQRVPLVSLEAMLNEPLPTIGQRVRCAVLYGTDPDIAMPYYAVLLSGVPRSEEVSAHSFAEEISSESGFWHMSADLGGRRVGIPDIRQLEAQIDEMRLRFDRDSTSA
jgi:chemosensory pili system protein ChpC